MKRMMLLTAMTAAQLATAAWAAEPLEGKDWDAKERFMVRARVINVSPDESSNTSIGGHVTADDAFTPEVDLSYFFTDHVAAELIAATSKHDMGAANTALGNLDLGDVWALPPTLTVQYHFNPYGTVRPYAGAGLGYIVWYNEDSGQVNAIDYDNGIAYAAQAGVDIALNEHWALNADVKKLWHNVDASINGGAVTADVDLDPWVLGVGVAYRF